MSNPKELRKSLRNVVQAMLPDLLKSEIGAALHKDLSQIIQKRLDVMLQEIQGSLKQMDERSKDIQGYIVRQSLKTAPITPEGTKDEEKKQA